MSVCEKGGQHRKALKDFELGEGNGNARFGLREDAPDAWTSQTERGDAHARKSTAYKKKACDIVTGGRRRGGAHTLAARVCRVIVPGRMRCVRVCVCVCVAAVGRTRCARVVRACVAVGRWARQLRRDIVNACP